MLVFTHMDAYLPQLLAFAHTTGPRLATAIFIFFAFWIAGSVISRLIIGVEAHLPSRQQILILIGRSAKTALIIMGVLTALGTAGVNVNALVAGLGLSGFALGFALRDVLSNVLAGFLILFYRPFATGDSISVAGLEGKVIAVDLRYTSLDSGDKLILIPNSNLFTNPIIVNRPQHRSEITS